MLAAHPPKNSICHGDQPSRARLFAPELFAERRMDRSIARALTGRRIGELGN